MESMFLPFLECSFTQGSGRGNEVYASKVRDQDPVETQTHYDALRGSF